MKATIPIFYFDSFFFLFFLIRSYEQKKYQNISISLLCQFSKKKKKEEKKEEEKYTPTNMFVFF